MGAKRMETNQGRDDDKQGGRGVEERDKVTDINIFDEREVHTNCTVEIWHNSITDEYSIGWWENDTSDTTCGGDSTDTGTGSE